MKQRLKELSEIISNEDKNNACDPRIKGGAICSRPTLDLYLSGGGNNMKTSEKIISFMEKQLEKRKAGIEKVLNN